MAPAHSLLAELRAAAQGTLETARRRTAPAEVRRAAEGRRRAAAPFALQSVLATVAARGRLGLIAEVKARSPSRGAIASGPFDPADLARRYRQAGADALSVLTEERHFGGHLDHLRQVASAADCPILRKDFVFDPYQVYAAAAAGAAAVLLIAALFPPPDRRLAELLVLARELGLDALVEVHGEAELEQVLALVPRPELVGINARDLATFAVDLAVVERLAPRVPGGCLLVGESGIASGDDARRLAAAGCDAVLVGESLIRAAASGDKLGRLVAELAVPLPAARGRPAPAGATPR